MLKKIVKSKGFLAFCMGALLYFLTVLPNVINNNGIMIYFGDFMGTVLPYNYHFHDRGFEPGWDWTSGLGGDYLNQYSFANLFSPFTLIYMLLPRSAVIYAVPYVYSLEAGVGTFLAYSYLKRFVKDPNYAVTGGLVYAFSSFTAYNFAYHFFDVIMLFPLLPLALEELCINGRRGLFAAAVALSSLLNYFCFFGEVIFLIIYFFVRFADKEKGFRINMLPRVLIEAVIGFLISFIVIVPAAVCILHNPKTDDIISLSGFFLFGDIYKYLKLIQSMFMVPDSFSFISLFPELEGKYPHGMLNASVALYLPFFSLAGVISFIWAKKKSWEKILLIICAVMMFIPGLNSIFYMFNSSYYARWFYMPILIMSLVSVRALEEKLSFRPGIIACSAVLAGLVIYWLCSDHYELKVRTTLGETDDNIVLINFAVTLVSIILLVFAVRLKRDKEYAPKLYILSLTCIYMCFGIMNFNIMMPTYVNDTSKVAKCYQNDTALPEGIDTSERICEQFLLLKAINFNMVWGLDSLHQYNNIAEEGYYEFMLTNGFSKDAKTIDSISPKNRELCDLLSVKYFLIQEGSEEKISDKTYVGDFGIYSVLGNDHYIPMGFTYDSYITTEEYLSLADTETRRKAYMKYLVLDDPAEAGGTGLLHDSTPSLPDDAEYMALIERHRQEACCNTVKSSKGLTAEIDLGAENIVFFSAAYSDGWKAYVDGAETPVLKVNNGLVGVRVPAGHHAIELSYRTPGLGTGMVCSCAGLLAYAVYMFICYGKRAARTSENA